MKKFRGKALAALLSLALIASSLPVTLASASTKSVTGSVSDTAHDSIYLSNDSASNTAYDNLQTWIGASLDTTDHQDVSGVKIDAISHASGDKLVSWKVDTDAETADLTVKSSTNDGKEILSVLYEGTYSNSDGDDVTVKARKDFTVYVLDHDSLVVGKYYDSTDLAGRAGESIAAPDTFAQTANSTVSLGVYTVAPAGSGSAEATYTAVQATTGTLDSDKQATSSATPVPNDGSAAASITTSNDNVHFDVSDTTANHEIVATVGKNQISAKVDSAQNATNIYKSDASVASVTITAKKVVSDGAQSPVYSVSTKTADKATLNSKIEKKVDPTAIIDITGSTSPYTGTTRFPHSVTAFKIDKDGSKTYLGDATHTPDKTTGYVVTDTNIVFPDNTTSVTMGDGSVKEISGTVGNLTINDGSVSTVDTDEGSITVTDGNVGSITTSGSTDGSVTVSGGKVGNIDTSDADAGLGGVTVNAGTVGNIVTSDEVSDDNAVLIQSTDEDTAITTGTILAKDVTVYSDQSKVTVGDIKVSDESGTIKFEGDDIAAGKVNCDYRATSVNLGDEDEAFVGTLTSIDNAKNATVSTLDEDTVATVNGDVNADTIDVATDSDLKFTGNVTVDTVEGDGMMTIAAGKLYVTGSVSGTGLKLSDSTLSAGMTVFKADSDAVSVDDFVPYGFTLTKVSSSSVDGFKIDTLNFAGLQINKTTSSIAEGQSETFTATAYPGGTSIPAGDTVSWNFDGSDAVFDVTTSGNTATVKVLAVDPDFSSENKGTLTATLVDSDGYEIDDYGTASVDVSAVKTPAVVSDTTADFTMAPGASYQFKITSSSAPTMTAGTAGVLSAITNVGVSGNDYFIKVTAAANAAGKATGIYLNGAKLLVLTVGKTPSFTSDTTVAVKVAKGASYQYKITASAAPTFTLGSAGVFNYALVSQSGSSYFYKITAVGASGAQTGVYVNGQKVNVATVA